MIDNLKVLFLWILFRVEIDKGIKIRDSKMWKWNYTLHPRPIPILVAGLIYSPFVLVFSGYQDLKDVWKLLLKPIKEETFYIMSLEKPSKKECYLDAIK